jgi:transposase
MILLAKWGGVEQTVWRGERSARTSGHLGGEMSLPKRAIEPVPEETARVARAAFRKGNAYLRLRDELGTVFADEDFAELYPVRGQPAAAPWRLALVSIFQYAEGLSDRQAAEAVRGRIEWKYALGLELTDPGFDASVLSEFRGRLVAGGAADRLLDRFLERCGALGLVKARGRQRTDSTHVLARIRQLNRLTCVGETLRRALSALAAAAPAWVEGWLGPAWAERYGPRFEEYRLPQGEAARRALAEQVGTDGAALWEALAAPGAPPGLRGLPAVETLRQIWVQQYHAAGPGEPVRWRESTDLPPGEHLIVSPDDPTARLSVKRATVWSGDKAHLTETCDPDRPHLIVASTPSAATTPDVRVTERVHAGLARRALLPCEHLVDGGYVDADLLIASAATYGVALLGPAPPDNAWQARAGEGFAAADFRVDWDRHRVVCPAGRTSTSWSETRAGRGVPVVSVAFARADCAACPDRPRCTRSARHPRTLKLRPQPAQAALHARRQEQTTPAFQARYAARAGIEGTLSEAVRVADLRHARYRGFPKLTLQHVLIALALNFHRLADWWAARPRARSRTPRFVPLARAS